MKKAKIVLSAVALFAVVGGAFAFKASRFGAGTLYYTYTTAANGPTYCTQHPDFNLVEGVTVTTTLPLYSSKISNTCSFLKPTSIILRSAD